MGLNTSKKPINLDWFGRLPRVPEQERLRWLYQLRASIERVVSFGCWGCSEPLALMWTLDATEIRVVEKKEEHVTQANIDLAHLQSEIPAAFKGRSVEFIVADMRECDELSSDYFDLAFCERVLYNMQSNLQELQTAINEMARVVTFGGWVIAVENIRNEQGNPRNISSLFVEARLKEERLDSAPENAYCYRKLSKM